MIRMRRRYFLSLIATAFLVLSATSATETTSPLWDYKINDIVDFALSDNGEYVIIACKQGPACAKGQFYVFDQRGNLITNDCIDSEISAIDIADNGSFFIGARNGYYFSLSTERIYKDLGMKSMFGSVSISANGEMAIAGTENEIFVFDKNGVRKEQEVNQPVNFTAVSDSGDIAVAGTGSGIFLFERSTDTFEERSTNGRIHCLSVSDDGTTVACGMANQYISIMDSSLDITGMIHVSGVPESIALTAGGECLVFGTRKGLVSCLKSKGESLWVKEIGKNIQDVSISSDGSLVAVLGEYIMLFNSAGLELQEFKSPGTIQKVSLSKDKNILSYVSDEQLYFIELQKLMTSTKFQYTIPSLKTFSLEDNLTEIWSYKGDRPFSVLSADINGDGKNEIVCNFNREIVILDEEGNSLWRRRFSFTPGIHVMDLTGDYVPEVIVNSQDNQMEIQIFDGDGKKLADHEFCSRWYAEPPSEEDSIRIVPIWSYDIDRDGFIEVVCLLTAGYLLEPRGFYAFEYPSFEEEWFYRIAPYPGTVNLNDIDGDGQIEIVAGSNAPCNEKTVRSTTDCDVYVYALSLKGEELWTKEVGRGDYKRIVVAVVDLDGNGTKEIVGAGWSYKNEWGRLFVLDSKGDFLFGEKDEFDNSLFLLGVEDLDNNGQLEIVIATESDIVLYDYRLRERKRKNVSMNLSEFTRAIINDIDGDSDKEIILTSDDKKLLILNSDLEEEWSETFPSYDRFVRASVVNLNRCKNHLFIIADKLYAYTYLNNPEQPCIPWTIVEQQKRIEAENHIERGEKCIEEDDCECGDTEFSQAREISELIDYEELTSSIENGTQKAKACLDGKQFFEEAKKSLESGNLDIAKDYFSRAYNTYIYLDNKQKIEEIQGYLDQIEEVRNTRDLVDEKRNRGEELQQDQDWKSPLQTIAAFITIMGCILAILRHVGEKRKERLRKDADALFSQGERDIQEGDLVNSKLNLRRAKRNYERLGDTEKVEECNRTIKGIYEEEKLDVLFGEPEELRLDEIPDE